MSTPKGQDLLFVDVINDPNSIDDIESFVSSVAANLRRRLSEIDPGTLAIVCLRVESATPKVLFAGAGR